MWHRVNVFFSLWVISAQAQLGEISVAPLGHRNIPTGAKTYKTEKAPTTPQVNPYLVNFSQISNLLQGVAPILIPDLQKSGGQPLSNVAGGTKSSPSSGQTKDPILKSSDEHLVTVDLCYYFGYDFQDSHVRCDTRWNPNSPGPIRDLYTAQIDYLNELTLVANQYLNRVDQDWSVKNDNFLLTWRGAWNRSDYFLNYPENSQQERQSIGGDIYVNRNYGCDVNIFMHFNTYEDCFSSTSTGQEHSGIASGAACESQFGNGYAKVVDQGYLDGYWVGPQILAHHILLLLTTDLYVNGYQDTYLTPEQLNQLPPLGQYPQNCPNPSSLLHSEIYSGQQWRGDCIGERLQTSRIPIRPCLHD
ncbi:hypothetical protein TCAL_15784 [Tigriopus californicus]|uniref:Uncharacterized protein n=1 Tax=Tigriopus californicus TaxID=6832 RepID=A0A553P6J9_TIGCA|nr:uncharacterized protein LOC131878468 [Tigriopus californicus]TRY73302.1 hypothetical protein TCAL_15784 [Tigriopus californicus]